MKKVRGFDYEAKTWGTSNLTLSPIYIQAPKLKYALESLKEVKGKVLDVGCGAGNIAGAIAKYRPDLQVFGVDISEQAISLARRNIMNVNFKVGSAQKLPYESESFNAVTMFDVLEHLPKPEKAVLEIYRVLKPAGVFHFFVPLEKQPFTFYWLLYKLGWKAKMRLCGHIQFFNLKEIEKMVTSTGFKVKNRKFGFHPLFSLFDIFYFSFLSILGKVPSASVEGMIESLPKGFSKTLIFYFNSVLNLVGYFESAIWQNLPGGGVHLTAIKV